LVRLEHVSDKEFIEEWNLVNKWLIENTIYYSRILTDFTSKKLSVEFKIKERQKFKECTIC
jgi:hypothetical protein